MKRSKPKTILMKDVEPGVLVFMLTPMDEQTYREVRETYYTKLDDNYCIHHGCIQSVWPLEEDMERPRYINIHYPWGFTYFMIPYLPVYDIRESRYAQFFLGGWI